MRRPVSLKVVIAWFAVSGSFFLGCEGRKNKTWTYRDPGYYYRLISFDDPVHHTNGPVSYAWISASFSNLRDSVFWDSYNNLGDRYFIRLNSGDTAGILETCMMLAQEYDSASILIGTKSFFLENFRNLEIPFFCRGDSVVKVNYRIRKHLSEEEYLAEKRDLQESEKKKIRNFFVSDSLYNSSRDSLGFYWLERPGDTTGKSVSVGNRIVISYEGRFINGRFLERSPESFEMTYGTPDQVIEGLNNVIKKLKEGQSAKIILPSWLAFGEQGSSNGIVPPFTPLVYNIKVIQIR